MSVRFPTKNKLSFIIMVGLFSFLALACLAPVMRESDQASIIDGAVQLARGSALSGQEFYNYDLLFGTYWVVAIIYKLLGLAHSDGDLPAYIDSLVLAANVLSAVLFLTSLWTLLPRVKFTTVTQVVVLGCVLLSPVLLFSSSLCSPALCSAAFLVGLISLLSADRKGFKGNVSLAVVSFCAVACRADAVLALPFLCCLAAREERLISLVKDSRFWMMLVGAVLAIGVGKALFPYEMHQPERFFTPLLFASYLIFGLGASVLLYGLIVGYGVFQLRKGARLFHLVYLLAFLTPMLYYATAFFTPRYLILTSVLILATLFFERGNALWLVLNTRRVTRVGVLGVGAVAVLSFFVGIQLRGIKTPNLVMTNATYYPTADGYWSMGSSGALLLKIKQSNDIPLDHNQRVWSAWKGVSPGEVPSLSRVRSRGFMSFGKCWLTVAGKEYVKEGDAPILFDGRSVTRFGDSYLRHSKIDLSQGAVKLSSARGSVSEAIFLTGGGAVPESLQRFYSVSEITNGNDVLLSAGFGDLLTQSRANYEWCFYVPLGSKVAFEEWAEQQKALPQERAVSGSLLYLYRSEPAHKWVSPSLLPEGVFVARSALVSIMSKNPLK